MAIYRFQQLAPQSAGSAGPAQSLGQTIILLPVFAAMNGAQQIQVFEIYRLAAEGISRQADGQRSYLPQFSLN